jgi:membrane-associated phospholipid phosphatase
MLEQRHERRLRRRLLAVALVLAAAFLLVALLVGAGSLSGLDTYAAAHLMPGLEGGGPSPSLVRSILPWSGFSNQADNRVALAADVVTLPAAALVSSMAMLGCAVAIGRRLGRRYALVTLAAFALGNLVELLLKSTLVRPAVLASWHGQRIHVLGFDSSYPSGHSLRGLFLAGTIAMLWPRALPAVVAWLAALLVMLELGGFHTPSDIVGGVLLAGALLVALASLAPSTQADRAGARRRTGAAAPAEITPLR